MRIAGIRINTPPFFQQDFLFEIPPHKQRDTRFLSRCFSLLKIPEQSPHTQFSQRHPSLYRHDMCERSHLQLRRQGSNRAFLGTGGRGQIQNVAPNNGCWLVVSTQLKNISQNGNLPQIGVKIKNI